MALKNPHKKALTEMHFEHVGELKDVLKSDEFDGARVIYAITNPEKTEIAYIGDSERAGCSGKIEGTPERPRKGRTGRRRLRRLHSFHDY